MISPELALAIAAHLCRHRSVGLLRLTIDLLRDPALRGAWRSAGVDPAQVGPGSPLLFKAVRVAQEHVLYLEQRGAVEYIASAVFTYGEPARELLYLPDIHVVNWKNSPCPQHGGAGSRRGEAGAVQGPATKPRRRSTLEEYI
jgi:hypothetical protein